MKLFLCAAALSFAFEGIVFSLFPASVRKSMEAGSQMDDAMLRRLGILALLTAIMLAYLAR